MPKTEFQWYQNHSCCGHGLPCGIQREVENGGPQGRYARGSAMVCCLYPLVNIQKTMENHHFHWVNPL